MASLSPITYCLAKPSKSGYETKAVFGGMFLLPKNLQGGIAMDGQVKASPGTAKPGSNIKKMEERENLWLGLTGWLVLCYSASITGDLASAPQIMGWYNNLEKPFFTPGDEIFRPVWTLLYTTMAFAAWRMWMLVRISDQKRVFSLFFLQLGLNALWPFLFFRVRDIGLSFLVIILLLFAIIATIYAFRRIDQMASYLLYPYALWISFATVLNGELWVLN